MSGILDGTFTDFGSFDECLGILPNEIIGEAQYCALEMRPLLPPRPRFHNLVNPLNYHYDFSTLFKNPGHVGLIFVLPLFPVIFMNSSPACLLMDSSPACLLMDSSPACLLMDS